MIPAELAWLFWDVDPATIDITVHRDYVLERLMTRGDLAAMRWVRQTYSREDLADFLARKHSRLAPRERAFWSLVAGAPMPAGVGGGRPPWTG